MNTLSTTGSNVSIAGEANESCLSNTFLTSRFPQIFNQTDNLNFVQRRKNVFNQQNDTINPSAAHTLLSLCVLNSRRVVLLSRMAPLLLTL